MSKQYVELNLKHLYFISSNIFIFFIFIAFSKSQFFSLIQDARTKQIKRLKSRFQRFFEMAQKKKKCFSSYKQLNFAAGQRETIFKHQFFLFPLNLSFLKSLFKQLLYNSFSIVSLSSQRTHSTRCIHIHFLSLQGKS